jgi:hypothetical protein
MPAKRWVWLESQGLWGYGYQVQQGPNKGYWVIDPGSKRRTPPAIETSPPTQVAAPAPTITTASTGS